MIPLIQFDNAPLMDVVRMLARQAGLELKIGPGLEDFEEAPISLLMVEITAHEVLDMVLTSHGLCLIKDRFTGRDWLIRSK